MRVLLLLALVASAAHAQDAAPVAEAPSSQSLSFDMGGPYLLGAGFGFEARPRARVGVRVGFGIRDVNIFTGGGHPAVSATALGLAGTRRVEAEGGAGLTFALSRRDVYEGDGRYRAPGPGLAPYVYGGVRLNLPFGRAPGGERPVDAVLRAGYTVVVDRLGGPVRPLTLPHVGVGFTL